MATTDVWNFRDEALAGINLTGFELRARDGVVGRVVQSIEGSGGGYLVVDPGVVMPLGRHLLVPVGLVERIEVDGQRVIVHGDRERIKNAPEYDRMRPLDDRARNVFGNYFRSFMPEVSGRAGERAPAKSRPSMRRSRPSSGRGTRPARSAARSRSRSTASDEPTKEQLYDQARKLGIEGRSKMNKAQLTRVVGRRSGQPASS